ncbi:MAG: nuclear transport factor 2 family protein [Proteobacteria bacterium]|nr:nuclear transport factor 2 family protein [Pseudomonadota bacterium]
MANHEIELVVAKQAIYELSCQYCRGLDRLDAELLRSVFFEDAYCEYGFYNGRPAEFMDYAMKALESHAANHHMIGNALIEVEGSEAFGEIYFRAYHKLESESGFQDLIIAGRYIDRYERRDGVWKIAYRSERNDWSRTENTNDVYFEAAPDGLRGSRRDDAVYDRSNRRSP